jgi:hypothetical protein
MVSFRSALERKSRGVMSSSTRISAAGTRNGPKTFASWKSASPRGPSVKIPVPDREQQCGENEQSGGEIGPYDQTSAPRRVDVARDPGGKDAQVDRGAEKRGCATRVHDFDAREEVDHEVGDNENDRSSRNAVKGKATGHEGHRDHHGEDDVGRCGLDEDDSQQEESDRGCGVVTRERERPEEAGAHSDDKQRGWGMARENERRPRGRRSRRLPRGGRSPKRQSREATAGRHGPADHGARNDSNASRSDATSSSSRLSRASTSSPDRLSAVSADAASASSPPRSCA